MLSELAIKSLTKIVRLLLTGPSTRFIFKKCQNLVIPEIKTTGIYIHIPFCEQLCPYCPYCRVPYEKDLAVNYTKSAIREIKYYSKNIPNLWITSVYFGGGTPTVFMEGLTEIVQELRKDFNIAGPLYIETNPADLTKSKIDSLKSLNIDSLSLGIQSFNPRLLKVTGRTYIPEKINEVLSWIAAANFSSVNVDLMFALPGQTLKELKQDLDRAISSCADQITAYPLITFPYSSIGSYRKMKNVKMPKVSTRKEMFYFIYDYLLKNKYQRSSVWSFKKNSDVYRYSSVTRERYIGFGPSAGSYYGPLFTLNTFSVPEYINSVNKEGHAVALEMPFTSMLSIIYDFYWRIYDTCIPKERKLDNLSYNLKRVRRLNSLIKFGKMCGMVQENGQVFNLTRKGTFWLHLIQNLFFLRYVNTIWTQAMNTPWPESIKF